MSSNVENLILEHLRAIRAKQDNHDDRFKDVLTRLNTIEAMVVNLKRENASQYSDAEDQQHRIDRIVERIERIEKRLQLTE